MEENKEAIEETEAKEENEEDKPLEDRVNDSLTEIRQILEADGGGIELVEITDDKVARVKLMGHCAGCMAAQMTLSGIVEQILMDQVPEITGVEAING